METEPKRGRPRGGHNENDPFITSLKQLQRQITKLICAHRASRKHDNHTASSVKSAQTRDEVRKKTAEMACAVLGISKEQ